MTRDDEQHRALTTKCITALSEGVSSPTLRRVAADLGVTEPRGVSEGAGRPFVKQPTRCAECDCERGEEDCNWIKSTHDCRSTRSMDGTHCNVCGEPVHPSCREAQGEEA